MDKKLLMLPVFALGMGVLTSCSDDPVSNRDNTPETPVAPTFRDESGDGTGFISDNAKSMEEQQAYLESIGKEAVGIVKTTDFDYWKELAIHLNRKYFENDYFENDAVESWFENLVETTKLNEHSDSERGQFWTYIYEYTDYKKLLVLSNLKAHFNAGIRGWEKEGNAENLKFTFPDQNGASSELTLTTSGQTKTLHILDDESLAGFINNYEMKTSIESIDNDQYYIQVPEVIELTFKVAGTERIKTVIRFDLSSFVTETVDLSRNSFNANAQVTLDSYQFTTTNTAYKPNRQLATNFTVAKDNKAVLVFSTNLTDFTATGIGGSIADEDTWDKMDDASFTGGNGTFRLNLLNKIQVNGRINNLSSVQNAMKTISDYRTEAEFKQGVASLNSAFTVGVYYDGKNEKNAFLRFESFSNRDWNGAVRWEFEPVVVMLDKRGNEVSYSLVEENFFFNDNAFSSLIDAYEKLLNDFERFLDDLDNRL